MPRKLERPSCKPRTQLASMHSNACGDVSAQDTTCTAQAEPRPARPPLQFPGANNGGAAVQKQQQNRGPPCGPVP